MDKGCSSKAFFQSLHATRKKNSCLRVRKLDGSWTHSFSDLQDECHNYFQKLFSAPGSPSNQVIDARTEFLQYVSGIVELDDALTLERPFTDTELDNALFHLSKYKSPGWDGLMVEFYISFWDDLKEVLLQMIKMSGKKISYRTLGSMA